MKYECYECDYKTDRKDALKRHSEELQHSTNNLNILNKVINTVDSDRNNNLIKDEVNIVQSVKLKCKYCPASYTRKSNLTKHISTCSNRDIYETNLENEMIKF